MSIVWRWSFLFRGFFVGKKLRRCRTFKLLTGRIFASKAMNGSTPVLLPSYWRADISDQDVFCASTLMMSRLWWYLLQKEGNTNNEPSLNPWNEVDFAETFGNLSAVDFWRWRLYQLGININALSSLTCIPSSKDAVAVWRESKLLSWQFWSSKWTAFYDLPKRPTPKNVVFS